MKKVYGAIIVVLLLNTQAQSFGQEWIWNAGYLGFFDNREYFNSYVPPQTMFGSNISCFTGLAINENSEFGGGLNLLYEFGDQINYNDLDPIVYFRHNNEFINVILGSYPRYNLINLPVFLLSDTINYYRPNLEGIFLEFRLPFVSHNLWLDWTSRQDNYVRETFKIGGTGTIKKDIFFYRHDFIMTHFAGPAISIPNDHIRDNGGLYTGLGLNLSGNTFLDSLIISSGYCFSYDRLRNVYDTRYYSGSLTQLLIEYKGFGINASAYFGDGQVQMNGDGLYTAPAYNRADLYWRVFRKRNISGKVQFSFHFIDSVIDMSQSFTIYANLAGRRLIRHD